MPWFIVPQLCFYCTGGKRLAAHSKCYLISPSIFLLACFICFSFHHSILQSTHGLFVQLLFPFPRSLFSSGALLPLQVHIPFHLISKLLSLWISCFIRQIWNFLRCLRWHPHSLCSCSSSDCHLSTSAWLSSLNLFPCHSPSQGRPPVSSIGGHKEKLARRSDNLLTPHLSSERGKAPT